MASYTYLQVAIAFLLRASLVHACECECEVLVNIDSGPVCGLVLDAGDGTQYYSFQGIPYGKAPLGARRFQELEAPDSWEDIYYATEEGPACPQHDLIFGRLARQANGQSEDCIYANVQVPESAVLNSDNSSTSGLPILVMIHGGDFNIGSGSSDFYGPEYMMYKDVIVITFNYRLNVFGFLSLNSAEIPGNAGMRDQITLLRWVQRNARAFGGNPDDVTLMGQGAGAACAHLFSLSDVTQGLFKRLIMLSGTGIPNFFAASPQYAQTLANLFLQAAGINSTDTKVIHDKLINMPLYKIMYANDIVQYNTGFLSFVPVIEEVFTGVTRVLRDDPIVLIGNGKGKDYPILLSYTTYELMMTKWLMMYLDILQRLKQNSLTVLPQRIVLSESTADALLLADKVKQRYFNGTPTEEKFTAIINDIYMKYPTFKLAQWRVLTQGAPVYLSHYAYESKYNVVKQGQWLEYKSPVRGEDLTFIYHTNSIRGPNIPYRPDSTDDQMKEWMTTLVTNFMHCSNPTCLDDDTTTWPPVSATKFQYNKNSQPMTIEMMNLTAEDLDMIQFHDSVDSEIR